MCDCHNLVVSITAACMSFRRVGSPAEWDLFGSVTSRLVNCLRQDAGFQGLGIGVLPVDVRVLDLRRPLRRRPKILACRLLEAAWGEGRGCRCCGAAAKQGPGYCVLQGGVAAAEGGWLLVVSICSQVVTPSLSQQPVAE